MDEASISNGRLGALLYNSQSMLFCAVYAHLVTNQLFLAERTHSHIIYSLDPVKLKGVVD